MLLKSYILLITDGEEEMEEGPVEETIYVGEKGEEYLGQVQTSGQFFIQNYFGFLPYVTGFLCLRAKIMLCRIYILIKQLFKKCFSAWDEHVAVKVPCHGFKYKTYTVPSNQLDSFILEKGS